MAEIKIYGTLLNDTAEPIVYAEQITVKETGENLLDLINNGNSVTVEGKCVLPFAGVRDDVTLEASSHSGAEGEHYYASNLKKFVHSPSGGVSLPGETAKHYISYDYNDCSNGAPDGPMTDKIYLNTTDHKLYVWNGTELVVVGGSASESEADGFLGKTQFFAAQPSTGTITGDLGKLYAEIDKLKARARLTAWQKTWLDEQESNAIKAKFTATATMTPSSTTFDGSAITSKVEVGAAYNGTAVKADYVTCPTLGSFTYNESTKKWSVNKTIALTDGIGTERVGESHTITIKYTHPTYGEMTTTKTVNFTTYIPSAIMTQASTPTAAQIAAAEKMQRLTGTHEIAFNTGDYVYFVVPMAVTISKITSSGFDVPFTKVTDSLTVPMGGKNIYMRIYRTTSKPKTSPMNVVIS